MGLREFLTTTFETLPESQVVSLRDSLHPVRQLQRTRQEMRQVFQYYPDMWAAWLWDIDETTGDSTEVWWMVWSMILQMAEVTDVEVPSLEEFRAGGGTPVFKRLLTTSERGNPHLTPEEFEFWMDTFRKAEGINLNVVPLEMEHLSEVVEVATQQGVYFAGHLTTRDATEAGVGATVEQLSEQFGYMEHLPPMIFRPSDWPEHQTAAFKIAYLEELAKVGKPVIMVDDNDGLVEAIKESNQRRMTQPDFVPVVLIVYPGYRTPKEKLIEDPDSFIFVSDWQQMSDTLERVRQHLILGDQMVA